MTLEILRKNAEDVFTATTFPVSPEIQTTRLNLLQKVHFWPARTCMSVRYCREDSTSGDVNQRLWLGRWRARWKLVLAATKSEKGVDYLMSKKPRACQVKAHPPFKVSQVFLVVEWPWLGDKRFQWVVKNASFEPTQPNARDGSLKEERQRQCLCNTSGI